MSKRDFVLCKNCKNTVLVGQEVYTVELDEELYYICKDCVTKEILTQDSIDRSVKSNCPCMDCEYCDLNEYEFEYEYRNGECVRRKR